MADPLPSPRSQKVHNRNLAFCNFIVLISVDNPRRNRLRTISSHELPWVALFPHTPQCDTTRLSLAVTIRALSSMPCRCRCDTLISRGVLHFAIVALAVEPSKSETRAGLDGVEFPGIVYRASIRALDRPRPWYVNCRINQFSWTPRATQLNLLIRGKESKFTLYFLHYEKSTRAQCLNTGIQPS